MDAYNMPGFGILLPEADENGMFSVKANESWLALAPNVLADLLIRAAGITVATAPQRAAGSSGAQTQAKL